MSFAPPPPPSPSSPDGQPAGRPGPFPPVDEPTLQQPGYQQPGYQQPGFQQPGYQQPGFQQAGYQPPPGVSEPFGSGSPSGPKRRGGGLLVGLMILGPVVVISLSVWAFLRGRDSEERARNAVEDAQATVDSALEGAQQQLDDILASIPPVTLPEMALPEVTLPVPAASLPDPAATAPTATAPAATAPAATTPVAPPAVTLLGTEGVTALIASYEAAIGASPARLLSLKLYPDYAFATAQSPTNPVNVDEYPYRNGVVGPSSPVTLVGDGDLETNLYSSTDVDWSFLSAAVAEAPSLLPDVVEGAVSHVIVERSPFTPDLALTVRVYVSGPRGGGYVEYSAAGALIQVVS
jgi:hypothetical protein